MLLRLSVVASAREGYCDEIIRVVLCRFVRTARGVGKFSGMQRAESSVAAVGAAVLCVCA